MWDLTDLSMCCVLHFISPSLTKSTCVLSWHSKHLFKVFPKHIFAAKLQFILTTTCNIPAMKLMKKKNTNKNTSTVDLH